MWVGRWSVGVGEWSVGVGAGGWSVGCFLLCIPFFFMQAG